MPEASAPEPVPPAPLHLRVIRTFAAPADAFRGLGDPPAWVGPLMISVVVGMLVVLAVPEEAFVALTEGAVDRRGRAVEITSDPEVIARYGRIMGMLTTLVRQPLAAFTYAGILTLVFTVFLRGEAGYLRYLAITTHAFLITALGSLAAAAVALARGSEPEAISPALLLPGGGPEGLAQRLLESLDLFTVWALLVAALGVSLVNRRRSWASAAAILLGLYLLAALGVAALTA